MRATSGVILGGCLIDGGGGGPFLIGLVFIIMAENNSIKADSPVLIAGTPSNYRVTRFVAQLYRILQLAEAEDPEQRHIHWSANGEAIIITNVVELTEQLPVLFRAKTYGSFVRQLNMYNFMKVKGPPHTHVFLHPFFQRDNPEALRHVTRKRVVKRATAQLRLNDQINNHENLSAVTASIFAVQRAIIASLQQTRELQAFNARLTQQLIALNLESDRFTRQLLMMLIMVILMSRSQLIGSLLEALDARFKLKLKLILAAIPNSSNDPAVRLDEDLMDAADITACLKHLINIFEKVTKHSFTSYSIEGSGNTKIDSSVVNPAQRLDTAQCLISCDSPNDRMEATGNIQPVEALSYSNGYSNDHNIVEGEELFSYHAWTRNSDNSFHESNMNNSIFEELTDRGYTDLCADNEGESESP